MNETGIIIECAEAHELVAPWRDQHDPVAELGIGAHITLLYPFVPPHKFTDSTVAQLETVASSIESFEYSLCDLGEFPGAIWLRPDPEDPFRSLTRRLVSAFPGYLPYEGQFPDPQPHLTLGLEESPEQQALLADQIQAGLNPHLPISCAATEISVFMRGESDLWQRELRIPLGQGQAA